MAMRDADAGAEGSRATQGSPPAAHEAQLQAWIHRVVRQDEAAFGLLYEACVGRVYGLTLRITRNAAQAEEATEDTFWQVWREAPRFDPARGTALSWMLTIARTRALDSLRARDRAEPVEDAAALLDARGETQASPLDLLHSIQTDHALHAALDALDAQRRQLVALAFFRGLTHDEIAAHTGLPLGTVKSHIRRALALLKEQLGGIAGTRA